MYTWIYKPGQCLRTKAKCSKFGYCTAWFQLSRFWSENSQDILKRNFPKVETVSKAGFPKILENMKNKSINMFAFIDNREKLQLFSAFTKGNSSSSSVAWEPALVAVGNKETVADGVILGPFGKTLLARLQTSTPACHSLFWHCTLLSFCACPLIFPFIGALFSCNSL